MKKIAYNTCFGGFSLSLEAQRMYAELKGVTLYFYKSIHPKGYEKITDLSKDNFLVYTVTEDLGDITLHLPSEYYVDYSRPNDRKDPDLIKVIETLGEKANGLCADIEIAILEDDELWKIEEYDGKERVVTMNSYGFNL